MCASRYQSQSKISVNSSENITFRENVSRIFKEEKIVKYHITKGKKRWLQNLHRTDMRHLGLS